MNKEANNIINITNKTYNCTIGAVMEQSDMHANSIEQNQTDVLVESVILKPVQESISRQTDTVTDEMNDDFAYLFAVLRFKLLSNKCGPYHVLSRFPWTLFNYY